MSYDGPTELYVNGEWTAASDGSTLETVDPVTEDVYGTVAAATAADVDDAVAAARAAAARDSEWRELDPSDRAGYLHAMADEIAARREEIVEVESRDNGKTPFEANLDVGMAIDTFRYFAGWTDKLEGSTIPVPGERLNYTLREPLGVTAHVVPWNYPFQLAGRSLAPALATGNTAVLKPSSKTPLSALYYGEVADAVGLPDGVLNVLPGTGSSTGAALTGHEDVEHVAFTGSTAIGSEIMKQAADRIGAVTLELGGKGPNVVLADADLDAATKGVQYGIFMNAGQMCYAGSRLIVEESVHDEMVERMVGVAESLPLGGGIDDDGRMGPLIDAAQREQVHDYVETAVEEGATVAAGGGIPEDKETGYFYEPTVLTDVTPDMTVAREEIFGPVLSVLEVSDAAEALEVANDSHYGLLGGVWTTDLSSAHHFAERLDCGMVGVNEFPVTFPQTPFGGMKQSGLGREQGAEAVREYTQVKNVTVNLG